MLSEKQREDAKRIKLATGLLAQGRTLNQAAEALAMPLGALKDLRIRERRRWDAELTRAQADRAPSPEDRDRPASKPRRETKRRIRLAAVLLVGGRSVQEVAESLGVTRLTLKGIQKRHRADWAAELARARQSKANQDRPTDHVAKQLRKAAVLIAGGLSRREAAEEMGIPRATLDGYLFKHGQFFELELLQAETGTAKRREDLVAKVRRPIAQCAAMLAAGASSKEATAALGVPTSTIRHWQREYADVWAEEYDRAMAAAVIVVRRQAGTEAVMDDPTVFIRKALAAHKWATAKGQPLFEQNGKLSLLSFYQQHYRPVRLVNADARTVEKYDYVLKRWALLSGDPPLDEITGQTLATFLGCLRKIIGRNRVTPLSVNTTRGYLVHIQAVLDHAGPAGRHNRDALEILDRVPYIRRPPEELRAVRVVSMPKLSDVLAAAVCMTLPRIPGIRPPDWWRAILTIAYNVGLRRKTLFSIRMDQIDWQAKQLSLDPGQMKGRRGFVVPLNSATIAALMRIRTNRELLLPWPHCLSYFYTLLHRLLSAAGISRKDHWGLHDLRKTLATTLCWTNPAAAQVVMDHRMFRTTQLHYVQAGPILAAALEQLPQPENLLSASAG